MIEVTKKAPRTFSTTCMRCGASFRYGLEDLRARVYGSIAGHVRCPTEGCGAEVPHPIQGPLGQGAP